MSVSSSSRSDQQGWFVGGFCYITRCVLYSAILTSSTACSLDCSWTLANKPYFCGYGLVSSLNEPFFVIDSSSWLIFLSLLFLKYVMFCSLKKLFFGVGSSLGGSVLTACDLIWFMEYCYSRYAMDMVSCLVWFSALEWSRSTALLRGIVFCLIRGRDALFRKPLLDWDERLDWSWFFWSLLTDFCKFISPTMSFRWLIKLMFFSVIFSSVYCFWIFFCRWSMSVYDALYSGLL